MAAALRMFSRSLVGWRGRGQGDFVKWDSGGTTRPAAWPFTTEQPPSPGTESAGLEAAALLPGFSETPGGKLSPLIFLLVMRPLVLPFHSGPGVSGCPSFHSQRSGFLKDK